MRLLFLILLVANAAIFAWHTAGSRRAPVEVQAEREPPELRLLAELAQNSSAESASKAPSRGHAAQCFAAGPLGERTANALEQSLRSQGFMVRVDRQQQLEPLGYWVYLPPANSLEAAQATGRRLAEKGVTDYVFVVGAEKANAISLGLYPEQLAAEIRVAQLKALGFETRLEKRFARTSTASITLTLEQGEPPQLGTAEAWRAVDCQA